MLPCGLGRLPHGLVPKLGFSLSFPEVLSYRRRKSCLDPVHAVCCGIFTVLASRFATVPLGRFAGLHFHGFAPDALSIAVIATQTKKWWSRWTQAINSPAFLCVLYRCAKRVLVHEAGRGATCLAVSVQCEKDRTVVLFDGGLTRR